MMLLSTDNHVLNKMLYHHYVPNQRFQIIMGRYTAQLFQQGVDDNLGSTAQSL